ncbi:hypothetical protein [Bifidobacterium pseudolongum]|uniref:VG15 protein n=1 Tax=Bifidobacterium pseudolongum TaxID=1694 RepID=UPI001021A22B|nr:hypothetical protein [Bifidobacterium pseudolongum]RYQ70705.1 hypothetical protein PG2023B_0996 [Bifidobacterium pseudolongum subsp. globosum]
MAWNNLTVPTANAEEFQQILDTAYKNYQDSIENLIDVATDEIETAINRNDMALKEIVREYTDDASQLARDYYHTVRQAWQEYTGQEFPGFDDGGLIDTDRILWQTQHGVANTDYPGLKYRDVKTGSNKAGLTMDDLWPDMTNIDDAQQFIGDMIRNALRSQTQQCMRRDPTQPRWARVPQGKTCAFCVMLASRGFAYLSDETAGKDGTRFHDDCDCRIIPSWGRQSLKGYNQNEYLHMYEEAHKLGDDESTTLKRMRREFPDKVSDGVKPLKVLPWDCAMADGLGPLRMRHLDNLLASSEHPEAVELWASHFSEYVIIAPSHPSKKFAYFSPRQGGIVIDFDKMQNEIGDPYETLIHECSHMLDWMLGGKNRQLWSSQRTYEGYLRQDALSLYMSHGGSDTLNVVEASDIIEQMVADVNRHGDADALPVHDMMQASLPDTLSGYYAFASGFGHAYDYYMNNPLRKTAEPFAEMLTAQLSNEGTWEAMQWAFPTSCRWLNDQIMKGI